ncbi:MAG: D-alanyl-D-alanine carboxypeptidase/D-alanyl-D-alanine-endopeptidase [Acidobacteria bacterium]|nr:D-alanyl-D-alanine carboxypeptidase/D-alanyl-D-alanine-endopeptidase [Acidobacteriota bacterium]
MNHGRCSLWGWVLWFNLAIAISSATLNLSLFAFFENPAAPPTLESPENRNTDTSPVSKDPEDIAPKASGADLSSDIPVAAPPAIASPTIPLHPGLELKAIDRILSKPTYRRADWGVDVYSLENGEILYSRNTDRKFLPASNTKLFTTAAGLDRLGADFRFKTRLGYEGVVSSEGVLQGDLVLFGGGDPDLADNMNENPNPFVFMDGFVQKVHEAGIRVIEGNVVGDDSYFSHAPYGEGWRLSDLNQYYGAAISGLSFYNNLIGVVARPSKVGKPVRVFFDPPNSLLQVSNLSRTIRKGRSSLRFHHVPGSNKVTVSGRMRLSSRGWSRYVPVRDPALYTVTILKDRLKASGIVVRGGSRSRHYGENPDPIPNQEIYVHYSKPLLEIISYINKRSQNLYAELLLRALGAELKGQGTPEAGLQVVNEFLAEAGVDASMASLQDGSGLSRYNLITPRAETLLLAHIYQKPYYQTFQDTLPVSGKDGTLRNRMTTGSAQERVFAKTGTLNRVATLGGYVKTASNKTLAFSILVNDYKFSSVLARRAMDEICAVLARY